MWLYAPNIQCTHGFSTRSGGVSSAPFNSLNLGGSEDEVANIAKNRQIALQELGLDKNELAFLKQVHGNTVCEATVGRQEGDALVSAKRGITLAVSIADCYPILFHDPVQNIVAAAHAGWRGTCANISKNVVDEMKKRGSLPENISVAIGQGICQDNFQVGPEVIEKFSAAGFPQSCWQQNKIDLVKCNRFVLEQSGVSPEKIWSMNRCTFEPEFFSYRRDKAVTGRMWAVISQ